LLSESLKFSVGRILESDILGIAAMDCNDGNVKGFVGYKYPTYACCLPCSKKNSGRTGTTSLFLSENGRPSERVVSIQLQPAAVILKPFFQTAFMPEIFRRRLRPSESLKFSVGRILESDILGIAAMDCNDGSIKDFVGYKYPTYGCCTRWPANPNSWCCWKAARTWAWTATQNMCGRWPISSVSIRNSTDTVEA